MIFPTIVALDLEGVFTPEIWIAVARHTGISELERTTRDEPDYDKLMRFRIDLLQKHGLSLADIQQLIANMQVLPGAQAFMAWLRARTQVAIISDTFYEFAMPLMSQLDYPMLLCHTLQTNAEGMIVDYHLRQPQPKRQAIRAFKQLQFRVFAAGDSYNDTAMLAEADQGFLFRPSANVIADFPQFPVANSYEELQAYLLPLLS